MGYQKVLNYLGNNHTAFLIKVSTIEFSNYEVVCMDIIQQIELDTNESYKALIDYEVL